MRGMRPATCPPTDGTGSRICAAKEHENMNTNQNDALHAIVAFLAAALNALTAGVMAACAVAQWAIPALCRDCRDDEQPTVRNRGGRCVDCALTGDAVRRFSTAKRALRVLGFVALLALCAALSVKTGLPVLPLLARRVPVPVELKAAADDLRTARGLDASDSTVTLRRVASGRSTHCAGCEQPMRGADLTGTHGDVQFRIDGLNLCEQCGPRVCAEQVAVLTGGHVTAAQPEPEPVAEPVAAPQPVVTVPAHTAHTTQPGGIAGAVDALAAALAAQSGPLDEDAVRDIAREVVDADRPAIAALIDAAVRDLNRRLVIQSAPGAPTTSFSRPGGAVVHHRFAEVMFRSRGVHRNVMLVGPAGTGKTHVAQQVHEARISAGIIPADAPLCVMNINGDLLAMHLLGDSSVAMGTTPSVFTRGGILTGLNAAGDVVNAFDVPCTIVLDEMDRAEPGTMVALNAALANGFITTPDGCRIDRHPDALVIATANTRGTGAAGGYAAAQQQDAALVDRFAGRRIDIDFCPGIEDAIAPTVAPTIRAMRAEAEAQNMRGVMFSYRAMMTAEADAAHIGVNNACRWLAEDFGAVGGAAVVDRMVAAGHLTDAEPVDFAALVGLNPAGAA